MSLKRILALRHAESQEDVDPNLGGELSDDQISITDVGVGQTRDVVLSVSQTASRYGSIRIYTSPSNRAQQTARIVEKGIDRVCGHVVVEPRIRNLNWGDTTPENVKEIERERYEAGVLHYQFPGGDHSPTFVSNIYQFVQEILREGRNPDSPELLVIVTHGFALRIIAKALLQMSDADFKWISNPPNCYVADFEVDRSGIATIREPLPRRGPV